MKIRPDIWLLGVPLLAAVWGVSVWRLAPDIESRLRREMQAEEARTGQGELGRAGARVEIEGRDLTVTTDAPLGSGGRQEAGRIVGSVAGLRGPVYRVLPPATAQAFAFSVTATRQGLVLAGFVPPGHIRPELLDEARERGANVRDDLRSALGAPEGFEDAARLLVRATRRLERGSGSLADRRISVSGDAPDTESYREAMSLLRALPAGYAAGTIEIRPPLVRPYSWSAVREAGGALVLGGHVPSEAERQVLLAFAREANPGLAIEDRMDAARGLESGIDFDGLAKRVLGILGRLESGRAELNGRALSVQGRLAARDLLDSLGSELRTARLPGIDLDRVELEPVMPRPYRLTARRREGRLFLAGFVPAEADRAAMRDLVQKRFPFDTFVDDLHLADGAPDGLLPAGRLALERLSALSEGEVRIEDRTIRLAGRSLYAELASRMERDFAAGLPAGWTGSADVTPVPDKPLDPGFCADLLSDALRREPVRFESGKAELGAGARKALAGVADVVRRCGAARLVVVSTVETAGDAGPARELADARAAAIASALSELGVRNLGRQASASKVTDAGKAGDRIAFEVQP
jgi:hypothetical protein